ncbi:MAG: helix-turn-helix transcriptional regulator [Oscillospiraceae bacterium]|jgi:transcriptional regulator with XRE-family HTH domain|nr:helix-turn-helix transcriptional regulator [Oscillospiraceae bacterium]
MKNEKKPELLKFSMRLKELRKESGLKQIQMAEILKCTWSHYQKIEYGQINISIIMLMDIADYFNVTTDYLLGRSDQRNEM